MSWEPLWFPLLFSIISLGSRPLLGPCAVSCHHLAKRFLYKFLSFCTLLVRWLADTRFYFFDTLYIKNEVYRYRHRRQPAGLWRSR
jgi:hypothetical protein